MNVGEIEYTVSVETQQSINAAQNFDKSMAGVQSSAKKTDAEIGKLDVSMTKLAKAIAGVITVSAIYSQFKNAVNITKEFNATISNLAALTGLAGDELKTLEDAARRIGATTSLSATQAAEGMRLIGSQVPELLKSTDALEGVTQAAAVLAEAAKTDLPSAAQAISGAINQFGLAASDTDDIINTLAAGAKAGASSVEQTAAALAVAGTTAKGAGVSFTEFNALVQTLAQGQITAAEAGTALRNVILRLDTSVDKNLRPSVVGVGTALRNMEKAVASGTTTYEAFGLVNKTAADVLLKNIDYYEQTAAAIEGTNEAYEQQAKNNDNLLTDLQAMNSAYENLLITVGQRLDPTLRGLTQTLTELLGWLDEGEDGVSNFERGIAALEVAGVSLGAVLAGRVAMSMIAFGTAQVAAITSTIRNNQTQALAANAAVRRAAAEKGIASALLNTAKAEELVARGTNAHTMATNALTAAKSRALSATHAYNVAIAASGSVATTASIAVTALGRAMTFLGGPVGIALLAATALYTLSGSAKEVAVDMGNLKSPLDDVIARMREMDAIARDAELRNMAKGIAQLKSDYKDLGAEVAYAARDMQRALGDVTDANADAAEAMEAVKKAGINVLRGVPQEFDDLHESIKSNVNITEEYKGQLLDLVARLSESNNEGRAAVAQYENVAEAMSNVASDAANAAGEVDTLSGALRTGSAAAAEYAQKMGRALEDKIDNSAVGRLSRDIRDNAEAWSNATKEQLDSAYAVAFATDAYSAQQAAMRKTTTARKGLTEAQREAKKAEEDRKRGNESNAETLDRLRESLYQTELRGRALIERQAELSLNKYATPEQIAEIKELAVQLKNAQDQAAKTKNLQIQAKSLDKEGSAKEAYQKELADLQDMLDLKMITEDEYRQYTLDSETSLQQRLMELDEERYRAQSAAHDLLINSLDSIGSHATDAFMDFATGAKSGTDAVMAMGQAIGQSVIRAMVDMGVQMAVNAVKEKIFASQSVATAAATGAAITAAYTPAAAAASVASFGGAATAGLSSMAAAVPAMMSMFAVGSRRHGGPVSAGSMYRVNEGGAPEVFQNKLGQQYMIPNSRGEVVSNKDANKSGGVVVNLNEDASRAGQVNQSTSTDEQTIIDIFVSNIMSDGRAADALQSKYGVQTQGR